MRIRVSHETIYRYDSPAKSALELFPRTLYLRATPLTAPDAAIIALAEDTARGREPLPVLHALQTRLYEELTFDPDPTHPATAAAEAFGLKRGVCQDYAQIFITAARHLGTPARYISGYFLRADGTTEQEAGHAWAQSFAPDLGWVAFDPANGFCPTDAHIRVAVGLDYLGVAAVRGSRF